MEGATAIISETFDAEQALQLVDEHKITHLVLLGPMAIGMLEHPNFSKYDLSSVRYILYAMGPKKIARDLNAKLPHANLSNAYGLVEGSGLQTWVPIGAAIDDVIDTVGIPLPYCELSIIDTETGKSLPPEQEGEVCTREKTSGTHFMKEYYKKPELTAETIKDGWLHSGDLGRMRKDGYLSLTGRVKDMLKVGGFNIAPAEVEEVLMKHPKIAQASVVGVPDRRLSEVPVAFVILKREQIATAEEIIEFCKPQMANTRVPRHVFLVDEFPITPQAKVQKFKLKEQAVTELGLEGIES